MSVRHWSILGWIFRSYVRNVCLVAWYVWSWFVWYYLAWVVWIVLVSWRVSTWDWVALWIYWNDLADLLVSEDCSLVTVSESTSYVSSLNQYVASDYLSVLSYVVLVTSLVVSTLVYAW